jgi:hypothetical protein
MLTKILLHTSERSSFPAQLFGAYFPFQVEPIIYNMATYIAAEYNGGYWQMYRLSNGGFFMHPDTDHPYTVVCDNYYHGSLSAEAFGIAACLYTYSYLSLSENKVLAEIGATKFHLLREYALEHPESAAILAAID